MGLLDIFDSPDAQVGLGLLAAASPRADAAGFGQRLFEGINNAQGMRQAQMQRQMQQLDFQQKTNQMNLLNGVLAKLGATGQAPKPQLQANDNGASMAGPLGSGTFGLDSIPGQSLSPNPLGNNNVPATPISASQPQQPASGGINGLSANEIAALQLATGKDLSPIWKTAKEGFTQKSGDWHVDANTGARTYVPDPTKGITVDPSGAVGLMPGAVATQTQLAAIPEAAKAAWTTIDVPDGNGGVRKMFAPQAKDALSGVQTPQGAPATLGGTMPSVQGLASLAAVANGNSAEAADAKAALALYQSKLNQNSPVTGASNNWGYTPPASQLEADKARALSPIELAKQTALGAQASGQKYVDALHDTVANEFSLVNRNKQILPLLDTYQTGGLGAEQRLHLGNDIANTTWLPQSVRDMGKKIAGGDNVAGKVLENQIAAAAITTMLDTLNKEGKPNRAIFQALQQAQEGIQSGNTTLKDVFALQERLYKTHFDEQQSITQAMKDGTYNPQTWVGDYSAIKNKTLSSPADPLPSADKSNGPLELPANPNAKNLVVGKTYKTRHGNLTWNGMQFIGN